MKIRVVSSKEEIETLESNEDMIHLAFRPSNKDIFMLVQKCKNLKAIHIPTSYKRTISNSTLMFLEMQNIALLEGDVWGHRKDINEYYEIKPQIFERLVGEIHPARAADLLFTVDMVDVAPRIVTYAVVADF